MLVRVQERLVRWCTVEVPDEELEYVGATVVQPTSEGRNIIFDQVYGAWEEDVLGCDFYIEESK